jgi:hypothetical protein
VRVIVASQCESARAQGAGFVSHDTGLGGVVYISRFLTVEEERMRKFMMALFAISFALGISGCRDDGERADVPSCDELCEHAVKIMGEGLSGEEKTELEAEKDEFMLDCAEDCRKQLDDEARRCFMTSKTEDDMKRCDKAVRKRKEAAETKK